MDAATPRLTARGMELRLPQPAESLLALHRRWPDRYPVLLESAANGTPHGRFTRLLARPGDRLDAGKDFLARFDHWWQRESAPVSAAAPFAGGWFLFLGYELAAEIEPTLSLPPAPEGETSVAWRMHAAIVHDHLTATTLALAEPGESGFAEQIQSDLAALDRPVAPPRPVLDVEEDDPQRFLDAVRRALEYIAAGDIYQANLSRAWCGRLAPGTVAADIYAALRRCNPAPFAGIAKLGRTTIVSSSPERLVQTIGRQVSTRPIAGTRPRVPHLDASSIAELIGNAKERAEHVMLVDLERNDLGRLCQAGTVRVDESMSVESYAHVHHIVSNVSGTLRADVTPAQVIRALFPGGTITGCPKVRCMQLIGELEGSGRGAYTGSMGLVSPNGDLDLNILIRTLVLQGECATLRTGAGIVADSDPLRELDETRAKARGVLAALQGTGLS